MYQITGLGAGFCAPNDTLFPRWALVKLHYIGGVWDAASGTVTEGNSLRQEAVIRVGLQSWENRVTGESDGGERREHAGSLYTISVIQTRSGLCVCVCVSLGLQLYSH